MNIFFTLLAVTVMILSVIIYALAAVDDIYTMEIRNGYSLMLLFSGIICLFAGLVYSGYSEESDIAVDTVIKTAPLSRAAGFIIIPGIMCIINLISPDSFGGGDIKLIASGGVIYGVRFFAAALSVSLLLAGICVSAAMISGRKKRSDHIPFAPFICLGVVLCLCLSILKPK